MIRFDPQSRLTVDAGSRLMVGAERPLMVDAERQSMVVERRRMVGAVSQLMVDAEHQLTVDVESRFTPVEHIIVLAPFSIKEVSEELAKVRVVRRIVYGTWYLGSLHIPTAAWPNEAPFWS